MEIRNNKKEKLTKICKSGKKMIFFCLTAAIMSCMFTIVASAAEAQNFLIDATNTVKVVVQLIGGGLTVWGVVNLLEGYGNDNAGAKAQ